MLAVLLLTGSILSMYFEREAGRHGELAATAKTIDIAASGKTVLRDEIPPPDPAAATPTVRPVDLPTVGAPVPASHAPQSLTTTASLPVDPPPAAMTSPGAAPIPSPPARSKRIDRSEVF